MPNVNSQNQSKKLEQDESELNPKSTQLRETCNLLKYNIETINKAIKILKKCHTM